MDELQGRMTATGIPTTLDIVTTMTEGHHVIYQEIEHIGDELFCESRTFMTAVKGVAGTDCTKVEGFLGRMGERVVQLKSVWQQRQKQLQLAREGFEYKDKVQEVCWCGLMFGLTDR